MRTGLCMSVAAASGAVTVVSMPAGRGRDWLRLCQQTVPVPFAFCPEGVRHVFLIENEPDPERGQMNGSDWPGRRERRRGVTRCFGGSRHEDAVGHACVQVHVVVER